MLIIALFGALMALISLLMIIRPKVFADGMVAFSRRAWFHPFEILSRLAFGLAFLYYGDAYLYPGFAATIGYLLVAVAVFLFLLGPSRHRHYADWSAVKFRATFRPAGFLSLGLGVLIIYWAILSS